MSRPALATTAPERGAAPRRQGSLAGTGALIRFILRRDRVRLPVWIGAITLALLGTAQSYADTFPTRADLDRRAELAANPIFIAFNGPGHGLDNYTLGAMVAHEALYLGVILAALMSVFLTVRHTRVEEESGRSELVRATVVGRHAGTVATLTVLAVANVACGLLTAAALSGLDRLGDAGAVMFGASMTAAGLVFTGVALVAAQLTEYARGAIGIGVAVLAGTYVLRAVGDVSETGLSWLSPFAWSLETRAFVDERWWPLLLSLLLAIGLAAAGMLLSTRRDVGAGLVPPRPGAPHASNLLVRPYGFALRLQRGNLLAWALGLLVLGAAFGALLSDIEEFAADNQQVQDIVAAAAGATLLESFLGTMTLMLALLATGCAIQSILRVRGEEAAGRAEPLLATGLARTRWLAGYASVAMLGSAGVLLAGSAGLGIAGAINQRDASLLLDLLGAGLAYVPAIWVVIGIALVLFGWVPRVMAAAWLVLVYAAFIFLLADAIDLPSWASNLSPLHHVPELPGAAFHAGPVLALLALAATLTVAGAAGFRRRDIDGTA